MTGLYMFDAAYKPDLAAAKAAGCIAGSVYLTGAYAGTCAQPSDLHAIGLGAFGNYEEAANEIVVTDHAGGVSIGQRAAAAAIGKGWPPGAGKGIAFSVDVNVDPSLFPHVGDVFEGIKAGVAGRFVVMVYGEGALIDYLVANHGLIRVEWLSGSSSFPGYNEADPNVGWVQEVGTTVPGTDLDRITNLAGIEPLVWWPAGSPYDTQGVDMLADERAALFEIRDELRGGVAAGQITEGGTIAATLGTVQTLVNKLNALTVTDAATAASLADVKAQIASLATTGTGDPVALAAAALTHVKLVAA